MENTTTAYQAITEVEETPVKKSTFTTYGITIEGETFYFKSEANEFAIEQALAFVRNGEVTLDKLLVAVRMLGHKATPIALNVEKVFQA